MVCARSCFMRNCVRPQVGAFFDTPIIIYACAYIYVCALVYVRAKSFWASFASHASRRWDGGERRNTAGRHFYSGPCSANGRVYVVSTRVPRSPHTCPEISAHVCRGNGSMGKEIYVSVEDYLIALNIIFFCCRPVRAAVCADVST